MTESEFETYLTDEIVCPHCGYKRDDSWEWSPNEAGLEGYGTASCDDCGADFFVSRSVSVYYSSQPLKLKPNR